METMYTVEQIASRWQVQERTVRDYINKGQLQAYKFGRVWRVSPDCLKIFEESKFKRRKPFQKLK